MWESRVRTRRAANILGDFKEHVDIHLSMTLALRQPGYALPDWAKHARKVAFAGSGSISHDIALQLG